MNDHEQPQLIDGKDTKQKRAEEIQLRVNELAFCKIPGYLPTPPAVIQRMLNLAGIQHGMSVLEPSAGSGEILDAITSLELDNLIVAIEINPQLCEILQDKGFDSRPVDFLKQEIVHFRFDRVLMHPPFEGLADIDHVRHASGLLKPGGRLIAVMSPGAFFRRDLKARAFREWIKKIGGQCYALPEGSFKESGTGVSSKLVVLNRPKESL